MTLCRYFYREEYVWLHNLLSWDEVISFCDILVTMFFYAGNWKLLVSWPFFNMIRKRTKVCSCNVVVDCSIIYFPLHFPFIFWCRLFFLYSSYLFQHFYCVLLLPLENHSDLTLPYLFLIFVNYIYTHKSYTFLHASILLFNKYYSFHNLIVAS